MIETTNPGYLAAQLYDNDPNNETAPDPFHHEYDRGVRSYTLATAAGTPPVFSQDVDGLVPGPTADDISNNRLIDANGAWVDAGAGLNKTTAGGTFTESPIGGNAGGHAQNSDCTITAADWASFTSADVESTGGFTTSMTNGGKGTGLFGRVIGNSVNSSGSHNGDGGLGVINVLNGDALLAGQGSSGFVSAQQGGLVMIGGDFAYLFGQAQGAAAVLQANNDRTFCAAWPDAGETANASGARSFQFGVGSVTTAKTFQIGAGVFAVDYTPASEKLGVFGATPVIQQATTGETVGFTAGAGTSVNDDSTFTGNVGATAYRISDLVKALKNYGMLAA